jgi:hypothetical protein
MNSNRYEALAKQFYDEGSKATVQPPEAHLDRDFCIATLANFGRIVAEAEQLAAADREAAVKKISELARQNYEYLTVQDKLAGPGRTLVSIAEIAARVMGPR